MTPDPSEVCSSLTAILAGRPLPIIRRTAAQVMALLSNPNSKVDTIADAMLKAMEFGSQVDLDRGCFALNGTTSSLTRPMHRTGRTELRRWIRIPLS